MPVDDDRIALMGRSMGGGVVMKALIAEPGLVQAASLWASVSSLEGENFDQFIRPDGDGREEAIVAAHGLPEDGPPSGEPPPPGPTSPTITEPVLIVHGRVDDTCPPRWARATQAAMQRAGVDSTLEWYDDGHAFGPAFTAAMDRTIRYFDNQPRRGLSRRASAVSKPRHHCSSSSTCRAWSSVEPAGLRWKPLLPGSSIISQKQASSARW